MTRPYFDKYQLWGIMYINLYPSKMWGNLPKNVKNLQMGREQGNDVLDNTFLMHSSVQSSWFHTQNSRMDGDVPLKFLSLAEELLVWLWQEGESLTSRHMATGEFLFLVDFPTSCAHEQQ